ncbi:MAG: sugar phosphate isomerase/epimerase family protein [Roseburia sp.]
MKKNIKISGFADEIAGDLVTQVENLKKLNIDYVEMRGVDGDNLIFHTDEKVREIKKYLEANGIRLSALGSPLGKIGINDPFEPHFESFKRAIEIAHRMECNRIRMFSFYLPENGNPSEYEGVVFERLGKFLDYASENDAILLHENEKGIYGEKAVECKKLMDTFYGEHFKAIFDFANFVQAEEDTLKAYELLKEYISYIHVKDALMVNGSVVPAGFGDGHVKEILADLFASGFDGFLSLEPHLFHFSGFDLLEKDGKSMQNTEKKELDGVQAFTLAYESFMKILPDK